jgi:hypothetical protein
MDGNFFKLLGVNALIDNLKGYVETKIELLKIEVQEKLTTLITLFLVLFCVAIFGVLAFFFLNIALALYLNQILDSAFLGFVILGSFYLLILIVLVFSTIKGTIHKLVSKGVKSIFSK